MIDALTLDQLRVFIAVTEYGNFSAAAKKLHRVQSAVSTAIRNLELQLGLVLFDRTSRIPALTEQGEVLLVRAKRICAEVDSLSQLASDMTSGLEAKVSLCVDAFFPLEVLVRICGQFAQQFPSIDLRVDTQTMSAVSAAVVSGAATLGVVSQAGLVASLESIPLARINMVPVVAKKHPLASIRGAIPNQRLRDFIQIVLSERQVLGVPDQGVISTRTWRVADLHTKRAMLVAGLGWGNLPEHQAEQDLRQGRLTTIRPQSWAKNTHAVHLSAVFRSNVAMGPAHQWLIEKLQYLCLRN